MSAITLVSDNEESIQRLIVLAYQLGVEVQPTTQTVEAPSAKKPARWYGSISKEEGQQLREELDQVRREGWER